MVANFCNVGAQISTWSSLIPYMKQYTTVSERTAAAYLTATLVALMVGRFVTTPLMKYISPSLMLGIYGAVNVLLMALAITRPGMLGAYAIVASSFFLSIMFPTIFALGLKGLGPNTKLAGSFLVMAIVGGAIFPPVLGWIARPDGQSGAGICGAADRVRRGGVVSGSISRRNGGCFRGRLIDDRSPTVIGKAPVFCPGPFLVSLLSISN